MRFSTYFTVFLAVFLWGIHGPAGRYLALEGVSMPFVTVVRFWIGTLFLFSYLVATRTFRREFFKLYKELLPIGLVGIAANSIVYHLGFNHVTATAAMLLENLAPFFVLFLAWTIEKERVGWAKVAACLVGFAGLILVVLGKGGVAASGTGFLWGVFYEVLAGLTFGYYTWASGRFLSRHKDLFTALGVSTSTAILNTLFHVFAIASVAMSPILLFHWNYPKTFSHHFWIAEMGILQSGLAYVLWNRAIHALRSSVATVFFFLTVFFTIINEIVFLGFRPNPPIIGGCALILLGVGMVMAERARQHRAERRIAKRSENEALSV